jgi:GTP-binding protein
VNKPVVAIIGRQNVGKSTLLNKIVGGRVAIVEDLPGTTRDRLFADASWQGKEFALIDTGGLEVNPETPLAKLVNEQVDVAINEADVIIFMVDARSGVVPADIEIASRLRQSGKPVILAANKVESPGQVAGVVEFYELSLGEPVPISAYHGQGVAELLDRLVTLLPDLPQTGLGPQPARVAIVGRPNVGKSTLLNALLGEERVITDAVPGTTRDAIDSLVDFGGQNVLLIDTAGIKRRGQVGVGVDRYSAIRAALAIERSDIALVVVDATETVTAQDLHVAGFVHQAVKGIIIVVNKWDLAPGASQSEYRDKIISQFKFAPYAPVLFVSAKSKQGVDKIMPQVLAVYAERQKRLPDTTVNQAVDEIVAAHVVPRKGRRELKVRQAFQSGTNPPSFTFVVNDPALVHFSYRRYLENRLRQLFGFVGTPLRLVFKARR